MLKKVKKRIKKVKLIFILHIAEYKSRKRLCNSE